PESVAAPDRATVVFRLRDAWAPFLPAVATWGIVPQYILGEVRPAEMRTAPFNLSPVGSGPFRFGSWRQGDRLILEANPGYFGGRPRLEGITLLVAQDAESMAAGLRRGEIDWGPIDPAQLEEVRRYPALETHAF